MGDRCEPPAELRGVDGWHWVDADRPIVCQWLAADQHQLHASWKMPGSNIYGPAAAYRAGYRYLSPIPSPEALAALVDAARASEALFQWYADEHVAAGKHEKAERNQSAASALTAALTPFTAKEPTNV